MRLLKHIIRLLFVFAFVVVFVGTNTQPVGAFNHTAATVDGSTSSPEYANNTAYVSGGQTWYMVWDNTNLYIGLSNANIAQAMVIYIDTDPQIPVNGGINSNGNLGGQTYDSTNFTELQFRANFVTYVKSGYREYRTSDGSGGWTGATSGFGNYAENGGTNTREVGIPWSAMGGRPAAFNWFGYAVDSVGYVYGVAPVENSSGTIGTLAHEVRYFTVSDTGATTSQDPFTRNSYVFNGTSDVSGFGAISVWDFTMNDAGRTITRGSGAWTISGNLVVNDGTINFGSTTDSATVSGDVSIGSSGTLTLSSASAGNLNVAGDWTNNGTFNHNSRTVTFNGSSGIQEITGDTTFFDLTLNNSGATTDFNATTTTIAGNFTRSAGTMDPGTSTIVFTGSAKTISGTGAKKFYNLDIDVGASITASASGGQVTIRQNFINDGSFTAARVVNFTEEDSGSSTTHTLSGSGTTIFDNDVQIPATETVNAGAHSFTMSGSSFQVNGTFNGQTNTVTFDGTTTLNGSGGYNFFGLTINSTKSLTGATGNTNVGGSWTNNGTYTHNSGTVQVIGTSAQTIGGSSTTTFNGLTVNNSNGVALGVAAQVNGVLTLTSGRITLNSYNLTVGPSASTAGSFSASNMIVADSTGQVRKEFSGTGSFTFPVGDATSTAEYSPATVNFTAGTFGGGAYAALKLTDAQHPLNGSADQLSRYWTLTQSGITDFSADVTFTYLDADIVGSEANLYGAKYNGLSWTVLNAANTGANTVGGTVTSFSDFTAGNSTLPVTLAYFQAIRQGNSTHFNWQTATETGNVGFNLYVESKEGLQLVNPQLIASAAVDSLEPQPYTFTADGLSGDVFYIEDVDVFGRRLLHGPFSLGNSYGEWVTVEAIDWVAIQAEQEALAVERQLASPPPTNQVDLLVNQDGIYRLTYEQLLAFGLNLAGTRTNQLRLTNKGVLVSVYVYGPGSTFGPGGYLEFYGQAVDSLYTATNFYRLSVGSNSRVKVDSKAIPNQSPAGYYLATTTVENNLAYSFAAPNGDPWYQSTLLAYTTPVQGNYPITINNYVANGPAASLSVDLWGYTDWPQYDPDHHLQLLFNGTPVADGLFNGIVPYPVNVTLPAGLLQNGSNTVTLHLPGDSGAPFDMVALDKYRLTYPRAFVAENGQLTFTASGAVFAVQNLPSANVVVYRFNGAGLTKVQNVQVTPAGNNSYTATFRGFNSSSTYFVSAIDSLPAPGLQTPRPYTNITSGPAQYLVIAHSSFIDGIQPIVALHQSEGMTTKVVDIQDIYAQFSYGMVYPQAIHDYVTYAAANMGTEYVLLVGGDTYDYFNYTGSGSISFAPTLYAATDELVKYAPMDSLYADVDSDNVPDIAIGRFPVRTVAELSLVVNKTLAYTTKDYGNTAIFAADAASGVMSYANESDMLISLLPAGWSTTQAYIDTLGVTAARQTLLDSLNSGVALTNFFGHSGPTRWTFLGLFDTSYAANLTNSGRPTIINQWGCWNSYHVVPAYNTLAHILLLSGERGAAAVLGASTLTQSSSDKVLGELLTPLLTQPGLTLGQAVLQAKTQLALGGANFKDVILGFTILGDPALQISP